MTNNMADGMVRGDCTLRPTDPTMGCQGAGEVGQDAWNVWRTGLILDRLRTANVLLITMKALANEIAKNLVLAGIGSLTIQDHQTVTDDDLGAQFFVSEQDVGKNVRRRSSCQRTPC